MLACVVTLLAWPQFVPHLVRLQLDDMYKLGSGLTLLAFLCFQWLLAIARSRRWILASKRLYTLHQMIGVFGPVFLYLHSARWGFGYLVWLAAALLANHALGLVHGMGRVLPRWMSGSWLVMHVALSVLMLVLTGFHTLQVLYRG